MESGRRGGGYFGCVGWGAMFLRKRRKIKMNNEREGPKGKGRSLGCSTYRIRLCVRVCMSVCVC